MVACGVPAGASMPYHTEIVKVVQLPEIAERWAALGAVPLTNTPEQFAAFLKNDLSKWAKVVRDSGAKVD